MELSIQVLPNEENIHYIDRIVEKCTTIYNYPNKKEICFVAHELVINAVEAMQLANKQNVHIEFKASFTKGNIIISVIDYAGGISTEKLNGILEPSMNDLMSSERGRGLYFVKNMVDSIKFKQFTEKKFLVKVYKKLMVDKTNEEENSQ